MTTFIQKDKFEELLENSVHIPDDFKKGVLKHYKEISAVDVNSNKFGSVQLLADKISSLILFLDDNTEAREVRFMPHKENKLIMFRELRNGMDRSGNTITEKLYTTKKSILSLLNNFCESLEKAQMVVREPI